MHTRIGGRGKKISEKKLGNQGGNVSHEENYRTGIALVQKILPVDEDLKWKGSKLNKIKPDDMKKTLISARASQRQATDVAASNSVSGYGENIQLYANCTETKIKKVKCCGTNNIANIVS